MLDICQAVDIVGGIVELLRPNTRAEAVLLVDDDDLYVRAITRQLRSLGFPYVFRASSAAEALDMLLRVRPSIVLTDMVMEHREAGRSVVAAAQKLGISVALVSGLPGLDETTSGSRFLRKADLDSVQLEHLLDALIAEGRAAQRRSATAASSRFEHDTAQSPFQRKSA